MAAQVVSVHACSAAPNATGVAGQCRPGTSAAALLPGAFSWLRDWLHGLRLPRAAWLCHHPHPLHIYIRGARKFTSRMLVCNIRACMHACTTNAPVQQQWEHSARCNNTRSCCGNSHAWGGACVGVSASFVAKNAFRSAQAGCGSFARGTRARNRVRIRHQDQGGWGYTGSLRGATSHPATMCVNKRTGTTRRRARLWRAGQQRALAHTHTHTRPSHHRVTQPPLWQAYAGAYGTAVNGTAGSWQLTYTPHRAAPHTRSPGPGMNPRVRACDPFPTNNNDARQLSAQR